jgi:tellurite resistance protein
MMTNNRGPMPVSYFGIVVGVLALANAWRVASRIWPVSTEIGTLMTLAGLALWLVALAAYAHKWLYHADDARAEFAHPVQSSFTALLPVSSLLAAQALLPYSRPVGIAVFGAAALAALALGVFMHGKLWQGGRKPEHITPAIYLPAVASSFVGGTAAASFGFPQLGMWFFGAGLLSWLAIESILLHRAAVNDPTPEGFRPILGIQLAPPVVGGVTYMSLTSGSPDLFAHLLLGYGIYQALMLLRLLPWIRQQAFAPSYWAFSFGVAALPTLAMRMVERGATGPIEWLAVALFIAGNAIIGLLIVKTVGLAVRGTLLPVAITASPAPVLQASSTQ